MLLRTKEGVSSLFTSVGNFPVQAKKCVKKQLIAGQSAAAIACGRQALHTAAFLRRNSEKGVESGESSERSVLLSNKRRAEECLFVVFSGGKKVSHSTFLQQPSTLDPRCKVETQMRLHGAEPRFSPTDVTLLYPTSQWALDPLTIHLQKSSTSPRALHSASLQQPDTREEMQCL